MEQKIFNDFRDIIYQNSGITLRPGKEALLSSRVAKRMRALNIGSHSDYLRFIQDDANGPELVHLLDAISTNVTSFFRESEHFDFIARKVREWAEQGQTRMRFWSAACSTGEEPYSLAITLLDALEHQHLDVKILATDISTRVLDKCHKGVYDHDKVRTISPQLRFQYLTSENGGTPRRYRIKPEIRKLVVLKRLNLSTPPFPMKGPLDIILCRNVMIYFDNAIRRGLLSEMYRLLKPGGFLMVGHAESLTGMMSNFTVVKPSIYTKA